MTAPVVIYTSGFCGYCHRARRLLERKDIAFEEIQVDRDAGHRDEMRRRSGRRSVPQIFIGDHHVGGCDDLFALEAAGGLDTLLNEGTHDG